ncbi:MAG: hypothetical protein E7425_14235 [Ruminococcaceae bacterium]|nr:hypothetical protein [Oscillospiraceae bacterium]
MSGGESKMVRNTKKLIRRYAEKYYPAEAEELLRETDRYYRQFLAEVPDIGGRDNMLADNLEMGLLIFAAYEASGHRMGATAIDELMEWRYEMLAPLGKLIDANKQWQMNLGYAWYRCYKKKLDQKKAAGEWGNAWGMEINPDRRAEGFCFHLIGCPIAAFAKAHGYEALMPHLCASDHGLAKLMHAKLIRTHTVALGAESCDYWYVGDKSAAANGAYGEIV